MGSRCARSHLRPAGVVLVCTTYVGSTYFKRNRRFVWHWRPKKSKKASYIAQTTVSWLEKGTMFSPSLGKSIFGSLVIISGQSHGTSDVVMAKRARLKFKGVAYTFYASWRGRWCCLIRSIVVVVVAGVCQVYVHRTIIKLSSNRRFFRTNREKLTLGVIANFEELCNTVTSKNLSMIYY